ncbi:MAG: hypothetical protein ABIQ44_11060 [Chloroflexia bacterium]
MGEPEIVYSESGSSRAYKEFFASKELFSIVDLAPYFVDFWEQMGKAAVPRLAEEGEDGVAIVFVQGIGGRIQLVQGYDDKRMRVRIDYDADFEGEVAPFVAFLTDMGFYQTGESGLVG